MKNESQYPSVFSKPIIFASLGYFVDVYDLLLFSIVKKSSVLAILHLKPDDINIKKFTQNPIVTQNLKLYLEQSSWIIDIQMMGLLVGGIFWGILGDIKGRTKILIGSILLYSIANFFTSYVDSIEAYGWLRFLTGIGLAGELGAGITLVSELLPKTKRGIGTSIVAAVGILGCVLAYYINVFINLDWSAYYQFIPDSYQQWLESKNGWRIAYQFGGILGLALLALRIKIIDAEMFTSVQQDKSIKKGSFIKFFTNKTLFTSYMLSIFLGLPTWFIIGILVTQCDVIGLELGIENLENGKAVFYSYIGLAVGDFLAGYVCQYFQSRKKALLIYYILSIFGIMLYFSPLNSSPTSMYVISTFLGFSIGFWAVFNTMAAEQFGTNIRATAATTIPNMVRGSLYLANFLFLTFFQKYFSFDVIYSAIYTGIFFYILTFIALYFIKETYHKNLNYIEPL